ncbi:hypothetical protein [Streptomyces celluloflavus]|uniref:Uncharacterized protein n=1 Tax=Streptomyces celluloflavus TaxID=58344 RepID=A0ABW7R7H8_9ACTN|nr:hypothetical protein OG717_16290 [Streptomyces celluloflavus]
MPHRTAGPTARLLPWSGAGEQPCHLLTDGAGYVSRVADRVEAVQLTMGAELLGHARELLRDPRADAGQLRYLATRLSEALRDAVRVAESRGARLLHAEASPGSGASPGEAESPERGEGGPGATR